MHCAVRKRGPWWSLSHRGTSWSPHRDLNSRPRPYQGRALPLSYEGPNHNHSRGMAACSVGSDGFEPPKLSRLVYSQVHLSTLATAHTPARRSCSPSMRCRQARGATQHTPPESIPNSRRRGNAIPGSHLACPRLRRSDENARGADGQSRTDNLLFTKQLLCH